MIFYYFFGCTLLSVLSYSAFFSACTYWGGPGLILYSSGSFLVSSYTSGYKLGGDFSCQCIPGNVEKQSWLSQVEGKRCYGHLGGEGQGTPYNAQEHPYNKDFTDSKWQKMLKLRNYSLHIFQWYSYPDTI